MTPLPGIRFELGQNFFLPPDAVTRKIAMLGMSGSGKTYCAGKFVEEILRTHHGQIVIVDTVGNWYGLRLAADGKEVGYQIPVFGGNHGDIPLEANAGEIVAELLAKKKFSVILDVSDFTEGEKRKFVTAFARRLLAEKKLAPGPMMVLWEECHECIPQRVDAADAPMVGAVERLVKRGRNYGIGTTLVSQQPQAVNKAVLNQAQLLLAFQTSGKHERKAIKDWVDANQAEAGPLEELASLPQGTAIVWSPAWLKVLTTVKIGKKVTFDASATPEFDKDHVAPAALLSADLEEIMKSMAAAVERVAADDPKILRQRIAELEKKVRGGVDAKPVTQVVEKIVEKPVARSEDIRKLQALVERVEKAAAKVQEGAQDLVAVGPLLQRLKESASLEPLDGKPRPTLVDLRKTGAALPVDVAKMKLVPAAATAARIDVGTTLSDIADRRDQATATDLGRCARALLSVLAQREPLSYSQLATLSGYSIRSSSFKNGISELSTQGLLSKRDGMISMTGVGRSAIKWDVPPTPKTTEELRELWRAKLGKCARALFGVLCSYGPVSRSTLADLSKYSETSSSFKNGISELSTNGLVLKEGGYLSLHPELDF